MKLRIKILQILSYIFTQGCRNILKWKEIPILTSSTIITLLSCIPQLRISSLGEETIKLLELFC